MCIRDRAGRAQSPPQSRGAQPAKRRRRPGQPRVAPERACDQRQVLRHHPATVRLVPAHQPAMGHPLGVAKRQQPKLAFQ
eukprot:8792547-Alexandrium_andersonii.AAC.1